MKFITSVEHRNIVADHYLEDGKFMIWYHTKDFKKTVGFVQIRGIREPLSENELKHHIDKLWEEYYKTREAEISK